MNRWNATVVAGGATFLIISFSFARSSQRIIEISSDGHETVVLNDAEAPAEAVASALGSSITFSMTPDWQNGLRRQVGGLQVADMNNDGWLDVVVGCYQSNSFPPYEHWYNYIYYNIGGELEAEPSWISDDEVSTGDIQVADFNNDGYLDIFAANGGFAMSDSVIYFGSADGPSTTPGWTSNEPGNAWNNYALPVDIDDDGDIDVITANQGNSPNDPYRPMFLFRNNAGVLETAPSWQSAEESIQGFLDAADYDGDGDLDVAVSKWANFESGIYESVRGELQTTPSWTTRNDHTDRGVQWADFDDNGWPDLALGWDVTRVYGNENGTLAIAWEADPDQFFGPQDMRVYDVDDDGDLDLAEVHFSNGHARIYENQNGVLTTLPAWQFDSPHVGTAIAFGDINGDGRTDLVMGNSGDNSVMVFYANPPACPADIDGDGEVDFDDFTVLLASWGPCAAPGSCDADLDGDDDVDFDDFTALLASWGPCP